MSNPNTISRGNLTGEWALAVTLSPTSCSATTTTLQTFTVQGLIPGDLVDVTTSSPISATGGLGIINSRVSAVYSLQLEFINPANVVITPSASVVYNLLVSRPENLSQTNVSIMSGIT